MKMKKKLFSTLILVTLLASVLPSLPVMASPDPGLVGLWHFDDGPGSTAFDSSGNDNDGTLSGGRFGNGIRTDGVAGHSVVVPDSATLDVTGAITIEAWMKMDTSTTRYEGFIRKNGAYLLEVQQTNENTPNAAVFGVWISGNFRGVWGTVTLNDGNWHHIAGTYDGVNLKIYEDGVEVTQGQSGSISTSNNNLVIGGGYSNEIFNGWVDEVRISKVARTIIGVPEEPFTSDFDTVGLWHFDESIGTTAYDSSGNNNHGTLNGVNWAGPIWTTTAIDGPYALSFDGIDDYVEVADSPSLDITSAIYIGAWVYPHALGSWDRVIAKGAGLPLSDWAYVFGISSLNGIYFGLFSGGSQTYIVGDADIPTNTWTHVEATWDGTTMKIYINGAVQPETQSFTGPINPTSNNLKFGLAPYGGIPYAFDGIVDELCIWNVGFPLKLNFQPESSSMVLQGATATLKVKLTDTNNNPVEGIPITFSNELTFDPNPSYTDSTGASTTPSTSTTGLYIITAKAPTPFGPVSDTWTLVVYDKNGMTAGGGWYYPEDDNHDLIEGARATFGFVAKYIKGASTGNLEFQYHAAEGFNLKSTTIDYLVVTGAIAKFGGKATVNGVTGYFFRVMAHDVAEPGIGKDIFDIKIWLGDPNLDGTLFHSSHNVLAGGNIMVKNK